MMSDASLARDLSLPLVEPVSLPWISRPYRNGDKGKEDDAVIRVGLPVFDSLSTKDFLNFARMNDQRSKHLELSFVRQFKVRSLDILLIRQRQ